MALLFHRSKVHLVSIGLKRSILVAAVIIYLLTLQIFNLIITLTKDGGMASPFVAFTLAPLTLLAPLSLVRGGHYYYPNGNLYYQSSHGFYWLRRLNNAANGSNLYFASGYVNPQYSYYRGDGIPLRCLAPSTFLF